MPITSTAGQIIVNSFLPEDLKRYDRVLDKKGVEELFTEIANKHPDKYAEIAKNLLKVGHVSARAGGASVKLSSLVPPPSIKKLRDRLKEQVEEIASKNLQDDVKRQAIIELVSSKIKDIEEKIYEEALKNKNPFALQILSGARGNKAQLRQLVVGDLLVQDAQNKVIPVPILHGYNEGLKPAEYFAASYGARKGVVDVKLATADAGFFGKRLALATHRLVVTEDDCKTKNGIPVDSQDKDNIGAVLAKDSGPYKAGTIIDNKILKNLQGRIVVRSPITCQAANGLCAKCAGIREKNKFPDIGDNIGIAAAQAISEKVSQGSLSSKHSGGVVGKEDTASGFQALNQQIEVPSTFRGAATLSKIDGKVTGVKKAPQGGYYVFVNNESHYVPISRNLKVKVGDVVEAGDLLSDGIPNPAEVVDYKGIGEGRLSWIKTFKEAVQNAGLSAHRRNLEVIARGLINHSHVTELDAFDDYLIDEVVPFDFLIKKYKPRKNSYKTHPKEAINKYLETSVAHHVPGTRITPKIAQDLENLGYNDLIVNDKPPPFKMKFVRAIEQVEKDPNPFTRMAGSGMKRSITTGTMRNIKWPKSDTSPFATLAEGPDFGNKLTETGFY